MYIVDAQSEVNAPTEMDLSVILPESETELSSRMSSNLETESEIEPSSRMSSNQTEYEIVPTQSSQQPDSIPALQAFLHLSTIHLLSFDSLDNRPIINTYSLNC